MNTKAMVAGVAGAGAVGAVAVKVLRGGRQDAGREAELRRHVSDLLALDNHLLNAVCRQLDSDLFPEGEARTAAEGLLDALEGQCGALEKHLDGFGGHPAAPLKQAATTVGGTAAAIVDRLRTEPASRALRDDYAALAMVAISTTMLEATARFYGDDGLAADARRHGDEMAGLLRQMEDAIPGLVETELAAGPGPAPEMRGDADADEEGRPDEAFARGTNGASGA